VGRRRVHERVREVVARLRKQQFSGMDSMSDIRSKLVGGKARALGPDAPAASGMQDV